MNELLYACYLALIAAAEAVVHLLRIRAAAGDDPAMSGLWTLAVTFLRGAFVLLGASAVIEGGGALGLLIIYPMVAWLVTHWLHARIAEARP